MIIAQKLKIEKARAVLGWSQTELAKQSGVSRNRICMMESGKEGVKAETAKKVCDALGKRFDELFTTTKNAKDEGKPEQKKAGQQFVRAHIVQSLYVQHLEREMAEKDRTIKKLRRTKGFSIENDPITMVAEAFEELFPGKRYEVAYSPDIRDNEGTIVCSCITFPNEEDGPDAVPVILLNSQAGVEVAAESFAQELIHVALGPESLEHGEEYDKAFEQLAQKYKEIGDARFPTEGGENDEKQ